MLLFCFYSKRPSTNTHDVCVEDNNREKLSPLPSPMFDQKTHREPPLSFPTLHFSEQTHDPLLFQSMYKARRKKETEGGQAPRPVDFHCAPSVTLLLTSDERRLPCSLTDAQTRFLFFVPIGLRKPFLFSLNLNHSYIEMRVQIDDVGSDRDSGLVGSR